jgi:hypothetical protein
VVTRGTLAWLVILSLLFAGEARAGRVLLLDASATAGDAARILDDAVGELSLHHQITALGPGLMASYVPIQVPPPSAEPVLWLVDRAQREFENFELETASETLVEAGRKLESLPAGENGEALLQMHWLHVQLAMVRGEDALAASHMARIAELAPWWEPPVGYLTPELGQQWRADKERVVTSGVRIQVRGLSAGTHAWIDGFQLTPGEDRAVAAGRHLYRAERSGFTTSRSWIELRAGQRWMATPPSQPSWDDTTRALLRGAIDGDLADDPDAVLQALGSMAGVQLVVVAFRTATDPPGTVRAAAIVPGERTWQLPLRTCSAYDLASAVAEIAVDPGPTAGPVSPMLTIELGGALRLGGPAERNVTGGGGPAFEIGGGVDLDGHLELRAAIGLAFAGPVALADTPLTQRAHLLRAGGVVAPHIPLGRGASLWIGGGGGIMISAIVTALEDGTPYPAEQRGGFLLGEIGLDLPVRQGVTVGPSISYTHGWIPNQRSVPLDGAHIEVEATATRSLQFHLRFTLGVMK